MHLVKFIVHHHSICQFQGGWKLDPTIHASKTSYRNHVSTGPKQSDFWSCLLILSLRVTGVGGCRHEANLNIWASKTSCPAEDMIQQGYRFWGGPLAFACFSPISEINDLSLLNYSLHVLASMGNRKRPIDAPSHSSSASSGSIGALVSCSFCRRRFTWSGLVAGVL